MSIRAMRRQKAKARVETAQEARKPREKVACMVVKAVGNDLIVDRFGIYWMGFGGYPAEAGIRFVPVSLIQAKKIPLRTAEVVMV